MTVERFRAIVAVHLFLFENGRVLLLRRANTGYEDGNYSVIAGHLDGDETVRQAIVREAFEEAGIRLAEADLRFVHVMHRKESVDESDRLDFFFAVAQWQGTPENREPAKCSELTWAPLDALPVNVVAYIRVALGHCLAHQSYSEFWPEARDGTG